MASLYVATNGDDGAAGTASAPLRTIQRGVDLANWTDEVLVSDGTYPESVRIRRAGVGVRALNPGKAILNHYQQRIEKTAVASGFTDMRIISTEVGPLMYADYSFLVKCEVTNGMKAIGVHATNYYDFVPKDVRIEGCRIHHCGLPVADNNFDHGIYLGQAIRPIVKGNWIHDCWNRGIQLYPGVTGAKVSCNVVDNCGSGIIFGGNSTQAAEANQVEFNVLTNPTKRFNLEGSFDPARIPTQNTATYNTF